MKNKMLAVLCLCAVTFCAAKTFAAGQSEILKGEFWEAKKIGNKYILSLKNRSEVVSAIADFITKQNITAGSITGLGAVNEATLRFFNPDTKKYIDKTFFEQMEIANLTGNISTKDGQPYLHVHIVLGDNRYKAMAGHLLSAKLKGAGEFVIESFPGEKLERTFSDEIGLNLYDFDK